MSDIAIRLDGLILLLALGIGTILYGLIAIAGSLTAFLKPPARQRAWRVTGAASAMAVGSALIGAWVFSRWADSDFSNAGVDWVDGLTVPWVLLFASGCWGLSRV
jgi:hypothetical protein